MTEAELDLKVASSRFRSAQQPRTGGAAGMRFGFLDVRSVVLFLKCKCYPFGDTGTKGLFRHRRLGPNRPKSGCRFHEACHIQCHLHRPKVAGKPRSDPLVPGTVHLGGGYDTWKG